MRTEVKVVTKLEYIPVPPALTLPCLVPLPPRDTAGTLRYEDVPEYTGQVLGVLEQCNIRLACIQDLMDGKDLADCEDLRSTEQ